MEAEPKMQGYLVRRKLKERGIDPDDILREKYKELCSAEGLPEAGMSKTERSEKAPMRQGLCRVQGMSSVEV